jgi:hypothetical protein
MTRVLAVAAIGAMTLSLAACNQAEAPPPAATTPGATTPAAGSHGGHPAGGKVFFVRPRNGDTIKSMATFEFGSEGTTIAAVPPGTLTAEQVRPGMTHYHLGVDTDCLPPGQIIPKADPWIHFGDGKNVIEMQLKPGPHKFVVQSGDDMHRTIEGLCETINVTVVE